MSPREEHPLDAHIRRVLTRAEATPPPTVWADIQRARQGRRRGGYLPWLWGTMLLLGGTATIIALNTSTGGGQQADRDPLPLQEVGNEGMGLIPGEPGPSPAPNGQEAPITPPTDDQDALNESGPRHTFAPDAGRTDVRTAEDGPTGIHALGNASREDIDRSDRQSRSSIGYPSIGGSAAASPSSVGGPTHGSPVGGHFETGERPTREPGPERMTILDDHPSRTDPMARPLHAHASQPYVLPGGAWWATFRTSAYDLRHRWHGGPEHIVSGFDEAEAVTRTRGVGLMAGYRWRGHWSIGAGVDYDHFEKTFDHTDRSVEVEQQIITYVVTLDAQVFVSQVDTVTTVLVDEQRTQGAVRSTITRIPLEFQWQGWHRRWGWGPALGLAAEITGHQEGYGLAPGPDGDGLAAQHLDAAALRSRHPAALLATASLDLRYMLSERWEVSTRPVYMWGILALGPKGATYAMPERWGLQLQLTHNFIRRRSE